MAIAIGICAVRERARWAFWDQTAHLVADTYVEAIQAHGRPGAAAARSTRAPPEALLDRVDGLMVIGGADLDPAVYGQPRSEHTEKTYRERDEFELALTRAAMRARAALPRHLPRHAAAQRGAGRDAQPAPRRRRRRADAPAHHRHLRGHRARDRPRARLAGRAGAGRARARGALPPPPGGRPAGRRPDRLGPGARRRDRGDRASPTAGRSASSGTRRPATSASCSRRSPRRRWRATPGAPAASARAASTSDPITLRALVLLGVPEHPQRVRLAGQLDRLDGVVARQPTATRPSPSSSMPWWWWDLTAVARAPTARAARLSVRRGAPRGR